MTGNNEQSDKMQLDHVTVVQKQVSELESYIKDAEKSIKSTEKYRSSPSIETDVRKWVEIMAKNHAKIEKLGGTKEELQFCQEEIEAFKRFIASLGEKNRAEKRENIGREINEYLNQRNAIFSKVLPTPELKKILERFNKLKVVLTAIRDNTLEDTLSKTIEQIKIDYAGFNIYHLANQLSNTKNNAKTVSLSKEEQAFYEKIAALSNDGKRLLASNVPLDKAYGQMAFDLACDLQYKLTEFLSDPVLKVQKNEREKFSKEFMALLDSQKDLINSHRHYTKKLITDIVKALALMVSVLGAAIYFRLKGKNPLRLFIEHPTRRASDALDISYQVNQFKN